MQNGTEGPLLLPSSKRRSYLGAQGGKGPRAFEALRQLDIFHQGQVGEPAQVVEHGTADENRLITGGDARPARAPIHQATDKPGPPAIVLEPDVEPATRVPRILQDPLDLGARLRRKQRIGMQEQQDVGSRGPGAGIHLWSAPLLRDHHRRGLQAEPRQLALRNGNRPVPAPAIHEHHFIEAKLSQRQQRP